MTSLIRRVVLPACVAVAALVTAAPAGADDLVADVARDTPISAYGGVLAWSDFDAATGSYRLVLRRDDTTVRAAMPGATRAFDVSLGPDARGRVVAVYTRCGAVGRGCDIYRYDVAARREARVRGVSSPSADEAWPVQWRGRLAFVRRGTGHDRRSGRQAVPCDIPYVKTLASRVPVRRLDRGRCATTAGMSIRGDRIVQTSHAVESEATVRLLRAAGGRSRVLARDAGGVNGDGELVSPSQSASAVCLTRTGNRAPSFFLRIDLSSGRMTGVDPQVVLAGRVVRDERGAFWYVQAPQPGFEYDPDPPFCTSSLEPCRLVHASASPFGPAPRTLLPQMRLSVGPDTGAGTSTALFGDLMRPVVRHGRVTAREPVSGVTIDLLGSAVPDGPFAPTGLTTTTDAAGRWAFTLMQPTAFGVFATVARGSGIASPATGVGGPA